MEALVDSYASGVETEHEVERRPDDPRERPEVTFENSDDHTADIKVWHKAAIGAASGTSDHAKVYYTPQACAREAVKFADVILKEYRERDNRRGEDGSTYYDDE